MRPEIVGGRAQMMRCMMSMSIRCSAIRRMRVVLRQRREVSVGRVPINLHLSHFIVDGGRVEWNGGTWGWSGGWGGVG